MISLGSRTERYVRVDISAAGHPAGFVQASRLVIGKAVTTDGVDQDADNGFESLDTINSGTGYTSFQYFSTLPTWKVTFSEISDYSWRADWHPLLQWAGAGRGVLLVPEVEAVDKHQTQVVFGRIVNKPTGKYSTYDRVSLDIQVTAFGV